MSSNERWLLALVIAAVGCGPRHLVPAEENGNGETAVAQRAGITLVAARDLWCESQLSDVSTPLGITIQNDSQDTLPVSLRSLSLVSESSEVFPALAPSEIIRELFGDSVAVPPPGSQPPLRAPPPPDRRGPNGDGHLAPQPPAPPDAPSAIQPPPAIKAPEEPPREQTLAPAAPLEILLVSHGGASASGGHAASPRASAGGGYRGGPYGYRSYYGWGHGWGWPWYAGWWPWGWWFGPAYLVGPGNPYGPYYDPRNLETFGPEQIFMVSLRDAELAPHERMGGLVFFAPAWDAKLLTLRFDARPEGGQAVELTSRFEVAR